MLDYLGRYWDDPEVYLFPGRGCLRFTTNRKQGTQRPASPQNDTGSPSTPQVRTSIGHSELLLIRAVKPARKYAVAGAQFLSTMAEVCWPILWYIKGDTEFKQNSCSAILPQICGLSRICNESLSASDT